MKTEKSEHDAEDKPKNGEWRAYGGDSASTHYSPLDQINKDTVKNLAVAWSWKSKPCD